MRLVIYVDMDYFFAACEEVRRPEFRGKPFVVGTNSEKDKLRGVVQAANYEARKFGIHSAMPTSDAFKLCKELQYSPPDDAYYEDTSKRIMELLSDYAKRIEVDSIDEAALEIEVGGYAEALEKGRAVKERIKRDLRLPCTIGISTGKVIAKMACDSAKPDGIKTVEANEIKDFLKDKDVERIPGVGEKTAKKLAALGVRRIGDLAKTDPMVLIDALGSFGRELFLIANGTDESIVEENVGAVSISRERTLERNAKNVAEIEATLNLLADEVITEAKRQKLMFKNIGVKARYFDFTDRLKSRSLNSYTDSRETVITTAMSLFKGLFNDKPVRKIGIRVSSLISVKGQRNLF